MCIVSVSGITVFQYVCVCVRVCVSARFECACFLFSPSNDGVMCPDFVFSILFPFDSCVKVPLGHAVFL